MMPTLDYRRLFDALPSPYLIMTADFTIVTVNDAYAAATMIDRAAVVGRPMFEVFPDNPDDPNADGVRNLRRSLQTVVATGRPDALALQRYDVRAPDGTFVPRYWSPVNTPLPAEDGTVAYIVHRVQDVTDLVELRRAGAAHEQAAAALQTRVDQMEADLFTRGRQLQDTNRQLQQVNAELAAASAVLRAQQQAKDRFIATLSHELRNPLASARAALDVLGLDIPEHPARAVLERQLTALTRMTDDLLDAARALTGGLRTSRRPLDLRPLVAATVRDAHAMRAARTGDGPPIRLGQPDTAVTVDGDPVRLVQMLTNLLDNAHKHTPAGTSITVDVTVGDGYAEIDVRDAGPGFPPESAASLFDPFVRAATAGQRAPAGLGLGLAVVRGIAETHDGTATAHSDGPGTGATFTVRLPLTQRPVIDRQPAAPSPRPPLRILFIDDNEDLAAMYQRLLTDRGDTVTVATTAAAALSAARRTSYDLILCDLALDADNDGYTIARRLRRSRTHRCTRLIAVSGFAADTDRVRSRSAGFDAHLPKPLDPADLDQLLAAWTRNWTRPLSTEVV
ncbi:ATP-binding protein [Plantactinospora siamensis]|uniref:histidine kinase n=1 Tax=Plantactinospora siamensis TaxID=555372 RepID=A0ABV6NRD2_9ACTN